MEDPQQRLEQALKACAEGSRDGLATIYESEAARMVTIALRILRRHDLAEEIVQEAFLQIWRKAGQYDPARGSARAGFTLSSAAVRSMPCEIQAGKNWHPPKALTSCARMETRRSTRICSMNSTPPAASRPACHAWTPCAARPS
ncbi:sigma factor [Pannonibacter sp. Pt2-lr]